MQLLRTKNLASADYNLYSQHVPCLLCLSLSRGVLWCCVCMCVLQVNGKVFRIGHLGNMDELMMCSAISGAEMAMRDAGVCGAGSEVAIMGCKGISSKQGKR